jgi:paraquat-inducible protein A
VVVTDSDTAGGSARTAARAARRSRIVVPALLAASLGCNALALVLPFMDMDAFLKGTTVYSLPNSVRLLWDAQLYLIAGLVVGFSIVFPFAKLAAQGWIWFRMTAPRPRATLLAWLERLGKWSFLDIFVVCVILILTSDQLLVGATPRIGLYVFVAAIGLSMVSAAIIAAVLHEPEAAGSGRRILAAQPGWPRWVVPPLLLATGGSLAAAVAVPYLKIHQFLLAGHAFSILRSVTALWAESFHGTSLLVAVTLVAMPVASVAAMGVVWFAPLTDAGRHRLRRVLDLTWQWSMLDVFGLALLVFLLEGRDLIKTEIRLGLPLFLGAALTLTATHVVVTWSSGRRRLARPRAGPGGG